MFRTKDTKNSQKVIDDAIEVFDDLIVKVNQKDVENQKPNRMDGRGVGLVEAPRGLLVHDYTFKDGKITDCNIITPTAFNLDDLEKYIGIAAINLNEKGEETDAMRFEFEKIARSYDPCISCATHLVNVIKN